MNKSELKTGMLVEMRDGRKYIVLKNVETDNYGFQEVLFAGDSMFMGGLKYTEDLKYPSNSRYDIIKVYAKRSDSYLLDISTSGRDLIWERTEAKEITSDEAFSILKKHYGCEVKIKE